MKPDYLVLDIETVSNERAEEYIEKHSSYSAPSNWKDMEKIERYILNAKAKDLDKTALHWTTGKIICICAIDPILQKGFTFSGDDERKILTQFFSLLETGYGSLVGKNSDTFDIPYIVGRAMALDLGLPRTLQHAVTDVDKIFGWSAATTQRANLNRYAFGLGIDTKTSHGSKVQSVYRNIVQGRESWKVLEEYCMQDVKITAEILTRYYKPFTKEENDE